MSAEEMEQYNELLDQFGGDEEQLAEAIQQFMEEYEKDPEAFERMMADEEASQGQQARGGSGGRGASRSPSPGGR
jgi:HPt (histidine-containing phosphotransfer) domain-containing protein